MAREGWGARLLASRTPGSRVGGQSSDDGLYSPKWISTTYTMLLLRDFGLPANNGKRGRPARSFSMGAPARRRHQLRLGWGRSETCVTGMVLSILSYFEYDDDRLDTIADHLLEQQMPDGGWNCRRRHGATHSSVHTTISALEGLRHYELHRGRKVRAMRAAQRRGREFLLVHRLFRSHRTGEIIKPVFMRFAFPPRWHYDILRALDYFQAVNARATRGWPRRSNRAQRPARGRPMVAAALVQGQDVLRAGTPRRAQPLEYVARACGC